MIGDRSAWTFILCLLLAVASAPASGAENVMDPTQPVARLRAGFQDLAHDSGPPSQADIATLIERTFDIPAITRAVLGNHAGSASPEQLVRLGHALALRMARETLRSRFDSMDDSFVVVETRPIGEAGWLVFTRVTLPVVTSAPGGVAAREQVVFSWRVMKGAQGLRIVDVLRDGMSTVTTQRDDFSAALSRRDLDTVIAEVERRAVTPITGR